MLLNLECVLQKKEKHEIKSEIGPIKFFIKVSDYK